nr:type VI secretion system protein TssA [uncultured Duganella sp.]
MPVIDFDSLMQDVDGDAPCGPNLEYDPDFVALEGEVVGKPEVQYGATITAAVPPDWKAVDRAARALLLRSHDLRLAVHLTRASLALHGMPGLAGGLRLIERLLEEQWDGVHPQLDADDDLDPTLRLNSLVILADHATVVRELKDAALIVLPGLGKLSLRMLEIAIGEVAPPEGTDKLAIGSIEMALRDADGAALAAAREAVNSACDSVGHIEKLLESHVGVAQSLSLDALIRPLKRGREFLGADAAVQPDGDGPEDAAGGAPAGDDGGRRAAPISGEIANRADVVRMLDKLIGYYEQHEPSSPLPILLQRAKRLVPKNFMEILEDLAPDGMQQANVFRGQQDAPAEY